MLLRALGDPGAPVRRAARARPALGVHLDLRDAGRARARASRRSSAEESADAAAPPARPRPKVENAHAPPAALRPRTSSRSASCPRCSSSLAVYLLFGREPRTGYDREYEQEPPTDTQPALVPTLLRQGGEAGSFEFTATLFDLIRRGVYTVEAGHDRAHRSGAGCARSRSRTSSSRPARTDGLTAWEQNVADGRRRRARRRLRAALGLPRADRGGADVDGAALHELQEERREGGREAPLVPRAGSCRSCIALLLFVGGRGRCVRRRPRPLAAGLRRAGTTSCCSGSAPPR